MNNKEYISELSHLCGYSLDDTQKLVRSVIEYMSARFDDGDNIQVDNFGTFEIRRRMERIVVNPSSGQKMLVPPKIVIGFKPSLEVKKQIRMADND